MGTMVGLMWPPRELTPGRTFQDCCCWCPHPHGETLPTHTSTGDPPTLEDSFGSAFCGVTALFLWVLVHGRFSLCSPGVESLFSPVLWKSYIQIIMAFKIRFPGDFLSLCQTGKPHMGPTPLQQWENFFGIIIIQFVGHPLGGYEIWFYIYIYQRYWPVIFFFFHSVFIWFCYRVMVAS